MINCPALKTKEKQILVIDDEEMLCETLKDILQEDGYNVRTSVNALSGLAEIEKDAPDLIISDIKLPDINGIDLIKRIKQERPNIEIIIITAFGEAESYLQAKEKGAFEYITKPINIPILKLMISKILCLD
ncbi:response regulator [bacterium]|nr:response regulator [bacterium]